MSGWSTIQVAKHPGVKQPGQGGELATWQNIHKLWLYNIQTRIDVMRLWLHFVLQILLWLLWHVPNTRFGKCHSCSVDYKIRDVFEDNMVEAKARGLWGQGQGHKMLSSRWPVLEDPHTWAFFSVRRYAESGYAKSSVYELWSIVFMVLSPLLTILKNSTSYGQIWKPKSR